MPDWYAGVEWHLEPGGLEGYDLAPPMFMAGIGPYVFAHGGFAAVDVGANIHEQRLNVLRQLRVANPQRIYELGCGGVNTLAALRKLFPKATLVGGDLSPTLLRNALGIAEGGSGVALDRAAYRRSVTFWDAHANWRP